MDELVDYVMADGHADWGVLCGSLNGEALFFGGCDEDDDEAARGDEGSKVRVSPTLNDTFASFF